MMSGPTEQRAPANLWFDVEDLFKYAAAHSHPSGIQRVAFEIYQALLHNRGAIGRIRFVRHDPTYTTFKIVPAVAVTQLFGRESNVPDITRRLRPEAAPEIAGRFRSLLRGLAHRFTRWLPSDIQQQLLHAVHLQIEAGSATVHLLSSIGLRTAAMLRYHLWPAAKQVPAIPDGYSTEEFTDLVRPGDFIVSLGATWLHPNYGKLLYEIKSRLNLKFALLIFDVIPMLRPEWFDVNLTEAFCSWFNMVLPCADIILTISQSTANDLKRVAANTGVVLHRTPEVIPIGSGFSVTLEAYAVPSSRIPTPNSYVLFVSTVEVRKNHLLLFRVWRRLLEDKPPDSVPTLVFAGRVGWLVEDLLQQLKTTNYLNNKISLIQSTSDAELASLYRGCLFTVFPSLYEGWGLPVTESLAFGKPCIIASGSSLPEAGGDFARYFDPEDVNDAYAVIRAAIENPAELNEWQAEIARAFKPVSWSKTVNAILRHLG